MRYVWGGVVSDGGNAAATGRLGGRRVRRRAGLGPCGGRLLLNTREKLGDMPRVLLRPGGDEPHQAATRAAGYG